MRNRQISATEFKAKCLGLLDEVSASGDSVTITKRGKPVAVLQPVKQKAWKSPEGMFAGQIEIVGDIVNLNFADDWESIREAETAEATVGPRRRRKAS